MAALSTSTSYRSAPRAALKSGDLSRDGRGRIRSMPPILHYGFRPFFFLAALHAGLAQLTTRSPRAALRMLSRMLSPRMLSRMSPMPMPCRCHDDAMTMP